MLRESCGPSHPPAGVSGKRPHSPWAGVGGNYFFESFCGMGDAVDAVHAVARNTARHPARQVNGENGKRRRSSAGLADE